MICRTNSISWGAASDTMKKCVRQFRWGRIALIRSMKALLSSGLAA